MQERRDGLSIAEIAAEELEADVEVAALMAGADWSRIIVHVDMDAFYAAVHIRDDPSLKDIPMAVGSTGMLSTSNYAARKFGVSHFFYRFKLMNKIKSGS